MASATRFLTSVTVGGLMVVATTASAGTEQRFGPLPTAVVQVGSVPEGVLTGVVEDERGQPVVGAIVSALGGTTIIAVTDKNGRFEFATLPPGPYVLRAHLAGFIAPRSQVVQVGASERATSRIAMRRAASPQVLAAGLGVVEQPATEPAETAAPTAPDTPARAVNDDHSETAWRVRHARRGVLKDTSIPIELLLPDHDDFDAGSETPLNVLSRTFADSARTARGFFGDAPFSGQVNLLTTSSFDTPQQLFSPDVSARSIAYASLAAPVGDLGDWMVRGAINQSDISSWTVAGSYTTRAPARHRYSMGLSYSTQRYDGGNPLTLRDLTDGSRNAGEVYAYDEFELLTGLTVAYGTGYAHYDYLANGNLFSPRLAVTITPLAHTRVSGSVSSRATAPGAEEFLAPSDTGLWLPPQRTFSSIEHGVGFDAERAMTAEVAIERDLGTATTVSFRAFRQRVDGQLATVFGADLPDQPDASLGHYLAGNAGNAEVTGYAAGFRTALARRFKGSIEYTCADGRLTPASHVRYLMRLAPSSFRAGGERVNDISTAIETEVPETATRVTILYRISDGFSRPDNGSESGFFPRVDGRFDVQIRQSLPFMSFTNAHWEMLLAVRNFFRQASADQSFYDELLVVRPPKRVVGGVTLRF